MLFVKFTLFLMCVFNILFLIYIRSVFLNLRDNLILLEHKLNIQDIRICRLLRERNLNL